MSDITKCSNKDCLKKNNCYRYLAKSHEYRQSYFVNPIKDCQEQNYPHYWHIPNNKTDLRRNMLYPSAIFLSGCNTVHEYKEKIKVLSENGKTSLKFQEYEIAECFAMKYENFIYLCNHINERFAGVKKSYGGSAILKAAMFYTTRADKVLLLSFADRKVAVLYNAGHKVDIRPNNHTARALRNAEKRRLRLLQKDGNVI